MKNRMFKFGNDEMGLLLWSFCDLWVIFICVWISVIIEWMRVIICNGYL